MTMPQSTEPDTVTVPVTQADREASAVAIEGYGSTNSPMMIAQIRDGERDSDPIVQAFARHRIEATRPSGDDIERAIIQETIDTLRHARIFITSREKMHPIGVELWNELLAKLEAAHAA